MASVTEVAKLAGYLPARDLGESTRVLDRMCEDHDIQPMVIGALKFYPEAKLRKYIDAFRGIPEEMVSVADWCATNEVNRTRAFDAIQDRKFPGEVVYGLKKGSKGRPGYYTTPESLEAFYEIQAPEEAEWLTLDQAAERSGLSKSKLRKLCDRDELIFKRDLHQRVIDAASLDAWIEDQGEARTEISVTDAPPPRPVQDVATTTIEMGQVLKLITEANQRQSELHREVVEMCRRPSTVSGAVNNFATRLETLEEVVKATIQADARREVSLTEILKAFGKKIDDMSENVGSMDDAVDELEEKLGTINLDQVRVLIAKVSLMIDSFEKYRSAMVTKIQHERATQETTQVVPREGDGIAKG